MSVGKSPRKEYLDMKFNENKPSTWPENSMTISKQSLEDWIRMTKEWLKSREINESEGKKYSSDQNGKTGG